MPEEQSVHARDGVADPQGCGNPLRSGVAGLSLTAASPPHPQEYASSRPRTHPPEATPYPGEKACHARRAKRPRQGWRGRSAGMREPFAIGHGGPFDRSGLAATPTRIRILPPAHSPVWSDTKSRRERPAMPEEQSVHARNGVADPQGCGNPLRSGMAGLSIAAASPPPQATLHTAKKNGRPGFPW